MPSSFDLSSAAAAQRLADWCAIGHPGEALLYLRNGASPLRLGHRTSAEEWPLPAHWHGLLAARSGLRVVQGAAQCWQVPRPRLVKLQFFVDQALGYPVAIVRTQPLATLATGVEQLTSHSALEHWYLSQAVHRPEASQAFARHLRGGESYQLVAYLHRHAACNCTLRTLAERYGVCVSHFRRLCHQALGAGSRSELRDWRAAIALLDIVERRAPLTDVALRCGYASSSHFARDIRQRLGVMPSSLLDITRLAQP